MSDITPTTPTWKWQVAHVAAGTVPSSYVTAVPVGVYMNGRTTKTEEEGLRYLYKAWVVSADDNLGIFETSAFIAKDEVSAKVKAILQSGVDADDAHVVLQRLGEVPDRKKDDQA